MCRQSKLALRKSDPTANFQIDCLNDENIKAYFEMLKETLLENSKRTCTSSVCNF